MATSEAQEIKKQETLVRFSIISYKTRLRVTVKFMGEISQNFLAFSEYMNFTNYKSRSNYKTITIIYFPDDNKEYWIFNLTRSSFDFVQVSFFLYC